MYVHRSGPTWRAAVLLGGVMGLGALTRAEHLHLWPFLLAYAWLERDRQAPWRGQLARWAGAVGVSLVVLAPVTVYGPINFAMANHAGA